MTKARTNADNVAGDISGVTAGTGLTGGGTSGTVTLTNDMATTINAAGDLIYGTGNDAYSALSIGTAGKVLKVNSGATAPEWAVDPTTDVVTTAGDLIYGTGADAVTRLGIGTAGQYLKVNSGATAPEWATLSAGGMTELASGSIAASATGIDITSISASYNELWLYIDNYSLTVQAHMQLRINNDSGTDYSGVYNSWGTAWTTYVGTTLVSLINNVNQTQTGQSAWVRFPNYSSTTAWKLFNSQATAADNEFWAGYHMYRDTAAISRLTVIASSGTFDSGTYKLFGVK